MDHRRIDLGKVGIPKPHAFQDAGAIIIDHHVGGLEQADERLAAPRALQVEGDAAFPRVKGEKISLIPTTKAGLIATPGPFDLDDIGAEGGEQQAGGRPCHDVTQFQHPETGEQTSSMVGMHDETSL